MTVRAVFFDVDDTLVNRSGALGDCLHYLWRVAREYWSQLGPASRECPSEDAFVLTYRNASEKYLEAGATFGLVLDELGLADARFGDQLGAEYRAFIDSRTSLFPDAISVLTDLRAGHVVGLMSNAPTQSQRQKIAHFESEFARRIRGDLIRSWLRQARPTHFRVCRILCRCRCSRVGVHRR